jgi:protein-L-isoaspartate(D-aspartate) O-methyltransferase
MSKEILLNSLNKKGFSSKILEAFSKVNREDFFLPEFKQYAYEDNAFPIGYDQTISQPYTIGMILTLLGAKDGHNVLEIGSGSGYALALLSHLVGEKGKVHGVEIVEELAEKSKKTLKDYKNLEVYHQNGRVGLKEKAPFDRILVSAASKEVPKEILEQLAEQGILVAPVDSSNGKFQDIVAIKREGNKFEEIERSSGFVFVRFV